MGGSGGIAPPFLASPLDGGELHVPAALSPGKLSLVLSVKKTFHSAGNQTLAVQPIASRYTGFDVHSK
jgi:hypothetical protein